jgi:hypothetical protein
MLPEGEIPFLGKVRWGYHEITVKISGSPNKIPNEGTPEYSSVLFVVDIYSVL